MVQRLADHSEGLVSALVPNGNQDGRSPLLFLPELGIAALGQPAAKTGAVRDSRVRSRDLTMCGAVKGGTCPGLH